jgi:glucose-fructose oxidoreductase
MSGYKSNRGKRIRYAVVGLGYISQAAALPAFRHAKGNSELAALVSGNLRKLQAVGKKYRVASLYRYEQFDELLGSGGVDAIYIGLPNHMHRDYAVAAARAGVHVLCEKPMAVTEGECEEMIDAAGRGGARLMIAYRLHFERANLTAVELARSGRLGKIRIFNSVFTMQVKSDNIRLGPIAKGGGTLYDIGIYCINAARYLFRAEPIEVFAFSARSGEKRFRQCDEMTSAVLRFPGERLATLTTSFGAASEATYEVVGAKGRLRMDNAYEYAEPIRQEVVIGEKRRRRRFAKRDQFAAELLYFSECIQKNRDPEPSGREGLADVRIIRALHESVRTGRPVQLALSDERRRPTLAQEIHRPPAGEPEIIGAWGPSGD